jgi:hypothetical protein
VNTDILWHLKPNEAPKADMILSRLSESGVCLLTGETENLVSIPVDFNTNNMLPTNMACLSKSIVEDILYTFKYKVKLEQKGVVVTFNTPSCFLDYNTNLLKALELEIPTPLYGDKFEVVYEFLMSRHLKGIDKIKYTNSDCCIEWIQLQRYWFSQVDKMKHKKGKVITGNFVN